MNTQHNLTTSNDAPVQTPASVHNVHNVHNVHSPSLPSLSSLASIKDLLFSYQWDWLTDSAQFKIGLWARQTGKDYTCAAEAVYDSLCTPNNHWLIIACGERQAIESLQHAKFWAEFIGATFSSSKTELRFNNGSRITALPAKPETIRGYSANLILTEFAFHDQPEQIWRAVFPILTNPLKAGPRKLRIISTPNGHSNLFHKLWSTDDPTPALNPNLFPSPHPVNPVQTTSTSSSSSASSAISALNSSGPIFSRHKITIHHAVALGLPINIPLLQRGLADTEAFTQEYLCEFLDRASVLLPYDLIATCESPEALQTSTPQLLSTCTGDLFLGIDFARKHDLTVAWTLERLPLHPNPNLNPNLNLSSPSAFSAASALNSPVFLTREVLILPNSPTPDQLEHLAPRIQRARRVCLDYTGAGVGLGDLLVRHFGEARRFTPNAFHPGSGSSGKIELCTFTAPLKHELFSHLRSAFERQIIAIPSSSAIREDLHSIQRIVTANGQIQYRAAHTADGHSDRATALALALRAAESAPVSAAPSTVGRRHAFIPQPRYAR